jgi:hypothetical protein
VKHPCAEPNCPELVTGTPRCPTHTRSADKARGTRQARGYDVDHDQQRRMWDTIIQRTGWPCGRCQERIQPGEPWHLDHSADRTTYLGPSHADCNLSAAGRARHGLPFISPGG